MNTLKMKLQSISNVDMIKGAPIKVIVTFAVPLIIANIFQMLYTTFDAIIVGKYIGTLALASVGATTPVVDLLLGLTIGLTNGISIMIAQKIGSANKHEVKGAMINGFYLILFVSAAVTITGLLFSEKLFGLINISSDLMFGAMTYSTILFIGAIITSIYNYEAAILRAHGNSAVPLMFLILSAILNILLNLFFVVICHFEIAGVAIATVISQFICSILCFIYIKKKLTILQFEKEDYKIKCKYIKDHLRIGLPMAFFQSLLAISFLVVQAALNSLGNQEVAAYSAAYKMDSIMMQTLAGFGTAISTYTAQNLGAKNQTRIHQGARSALKLTITLSIIVAVLAQIFNVQFMQLFVKGSEWEIINLGSQYIRFTSCFYFVLGINFIVRFVLTGLGEVTVPLGVGVLEVIIRCFGTLYFIYPLGFVGMTYINPLCWVTSTTLIILAYPYLVKKAFKTVKDKG